jgi:hypothetical protein
MLVTDVVVLPFRSGRQAANTRLKLSDKAPMPGLNPAASGWSATMRGAVTSSESS